MKSIIILLSLVLAGCVSNELPVAESMKTEPTDWTPQQAKEFCAANPEFEKCQSN